jgi:hypothetical protein
MRPDTHATIEVETPPVPALDAGAGWVLSQPTTLTTVLARFPILENFISGARRCTKVHGGVLRSPGSPPLWRPAWPSRPCKIENRSSFGQVSIRPAGSAAWHFRGARPKPVTKRDITYQNAPNHALATPNRCVLRLRSFAKWSGLGLLSVRELETREFHSRSSEVTLGHLWSSPRAGQGVAGATAPAPEIRA